ncbi:MAG TPA: hypothetical protein PLJ35_18675 [Anaerolineae bacterium]|nr:hypothetical protein [Anaerolineae bacterium]HOR00843.1 hypothetical protein [Anaerolineae bacterium]HPL30606.1 hypothetical protein [Anaerolineae bacterium]
MFKPRSFAQCCSLLGLLLVVALVAACDAPVAPAEPTHVAAPAPTQTPLPMPPQLPVEGELTPAAEAAQALEPAIFKALGVEVTGAEVPFMDPLTDKTGTCYELVATGTGELFESMDVVMDALDLVLTSHGWTEDAMYVADGPTGTARGYRQGDVLAIAAVGWRPSPDANCPEDEPIFECELTPEQQLYTISIQAVQGL